MSEWESSYDTESEGALEYFSESVDSMGNPVSVTSNNHKKSNEDYESIDELLELARSDSKLNKINLMENDNNYIGYIIIKCCNDNPYPTEMIHIHDILSEFSTKTSVGYVEIMNVFFQHIPKNINHELFLVDFEEFITNSEVNAAGTIEYCIDNIDDDILYAKLLKIICINYPKFSNKEGSYHNLICRFLRNIHEEFAAIIMEICPTKHLTKHLSSKFINIDFNKRSDEEITSAIRYLFDNGLKIGGKEIVITRLLRLSFKKNYPILFDYLLSTGCRPITNNNNGEFYQIMQNHSLTLEEICELIC